MPPDVTRAVDPAIGALWTSAAVVAVAALVGVVDVLELLLPQAASASDAANADINEIGAGRMQTLQSLDARGRGMRKRACT
jgi:hypothetical protein